MVYYLIHIFFLKDSVSSTSAYKKRGLNDHVVLLLLPKYGSLIYTDFEERYCEELFTRPNSVSHAEIGGNCKAGYVKARDGRNSIFLISDKIVDITKTYQSRSCKRQRYSSKLRA